MSREDLFSDADKLLANLGATETVAAQQEQHRFEMERLLLGIVKLTDQLQVLQAHCQRLADEGQDRAPLDRVQVMLRQTLDTLADSGVRPMNAAGKRVDLRLHEVTDVRDEPSVAEDTVLQEVVTGYMWNQQPLRRGKVIIAKSADTIGGSCAETDERKKPCQ